MSILNSYFDNIYLLNLDRREDRYLKVKDRLDSLNIKFERFSAIDGLLLNNNYVLACLQSHIEIIKNAKYNKYKRILIFEDDVLFHMDFDARLQKLKSIDNWKLLYLGASQYNWSVNFMDDFYQCKNTYGTFAYCINESIYDDILNFNKRKLPIDNLLTTIQDEHCYVFYPNICIADVSESDIRSGRNQISHGSKMRWPDLSQFK